MTHPRHRPRRPAVVATALVTLLILLAACDGSSSPTPAVAATPSAAACGPEEVADGGIDGLVVDPDGNPLDDIFLIIENGAGFQGSARTAEDGIFTAPGVAGEFVITTVDIDHVEVIERITVPCGELVDVELVLTPVGN